MTETNWLDRLEQSRTRIETLQTQFLVEAKKEISELFAEFFIQNPNIDLVEWRNYTADVGAVQGMDSGLGKFSYDFDSFTTEFEYLFITLFGYDVIVRATRSGFQVIRD